MPADARAILKLEVSAIVEIARRTMTVDEVLSISPGAIIELPARAEDPLTILINNKPIGLGRAVKVGENFGVQVIHVGDVARKLEVVRSVAASVIAEEKEPDDDDAAELADELLAGQ